jgi:hypothetical protein
MTSTRKKNHEKIRTATPNGGNSMKTTLIFFILFAGSILPHRDSSADMGQIHAYDATVSETSQKAIILHNGTEEVLILGTDIRADRKVGIIRFIPFPSEPQVSLAPPHVFETVGALLKKHQLRHLTASKGGATEGQAVELRLQKKLGAHDITVIKVNNPVQFRSWVNDYFKKKKMPVKTEYAVAEKIVDDYVKRGIPYFVFDFVEVTDETRFIEPVLYRFANNDLYYPLKTSNTFGGTGGIDLILILPGTLCNPLGAYDTCLGFQTGTARGHVQASTSSALSTGEIITVYPEAGQFFGDRQVFIQIASYWGDYAFDNDIFADVGKAVPHAYGYVEEQHGNPWLLPIEDILKDSDKKSPGKETDSGDKKCTLRPDPGPCKGIFEKYYFNSGKKACERFFYGGCQGVVPFETREECEALCLEKAGENKQLN